MTFSIAHRLSPIPPRVAVVRSGAQFRLVADAPIATGESVLELHGVVVGAPSRHSIQIGVDAHLEAPPGTSVFDELDRYAWRFLNHSCRPNVAVRGRQLVALRQIGAWEEVTFDYNTTEFDMKSPFACRCGAPDCVGEVRGFVHLTAARRARIAPCVEPHVLELARRTGRS